MEIKTADFVTSMAQYGAFAGRGLPQIAVAGKSNVGKSSLINRLCRRSKLARTSATPGKTRLINVFLLNAAFHLIDLPGYGFAKTGGKNRDMWSAFIGEYVTQSPNLCVLCLLVDLRHPGLAIDQQAYDWLSSAGVPLQIVGTKADKLKANEKNRNLAQLNKLFPSDRPALAYSSLKRDGFGPLAKNLFERVLRFNV